MRYREGEIPERLGPLISDDSLLFTAILGLIIGIIFVYAARKGRPLWILVWGAGLVVVSIIYTGYILIY